MSLDDWVKNGWLVRHTPNAPEIDTLLTVADRDLADCAAPQLSDDWRFGIAYNAALQLAHAALTAAGYKTPKGESHHYRAIQSLEQTIGVDPRFIGRFDAFRKKRAVSVYERAGAVSRLEADDMLDLARELRRDVERWVKASHAGLWPPGR